MLPTTNRTISVYWMVASGNKRVFTLLWTARAYINQNGEELNDGLGGEGAFFGHRMLTDGNHVSIGIGSRITDELGNQYDVRGKAEFSDITGKHNQYLLAVAYE